jgi:hypothetical protein
MLHKVLVKFIAHFARCDDEKILLLHDYILQDSNINLMIVSSFGSPHQLRSGLSDTPAYDRGMCSCCDSMSGGLCACLPGTGRAGGPQYIRVGGGATCCWCIPRPYGRMRYFCVALIGAIVALGYVMLSFQYTFSVDDVYDVVGPRELNSFEKITIRYVTFSAVWTSACNKSRWCGGGQGQ